jgi:hypothetical protein
MAMVIVSSKKDGLVDNVLVATARMETPVSNPRAKVWHPTLEDIKKHYPQEMGYKIAVF